VIEVILLECKHLIIEFPCIIPPLKVLLQIKEILDIFIEDIDGGPFLLDYFVDFVGIKVRLGG
jgi:hypothetical protein